jgi:DNA-binding NarL/FixJ family response regulator
MPASVLVVDDSRLLRRTVSGIISRHADWAVVGEAATGAEAIALAEQLRPDLITLDIELPDINGLEVLSAVMARFPTRVILVSSLTRAGADVTLRGLEGGALDFVPKASLTEGPAVFSTRLIETMQAALMAKVPARRAQAATAAGAASAPPALKASLRKPGLIAVASSTGGPDALTRFFSSLSTAAVPMVVVQHMPPTFTERLSVSTRWAPIRCESRPERRLKQGKRSSHQADTTLAFAVAPPGSEMMPRSALSALRRTSLSRTPPPPTDRRCWRWSLPGWVATAQRAAGRSPRPAGR